MDGLTEDLQGHADVLLIDLLGEVGKQTAGRYDVRSVPTFLVFDGQGNVVLRQSGRPDVDAIKAKVAELEALGTP